MTNDELRPVLARIEPFEGRVGYFYLCSAGKVTAGVGCQIFSLDDAFRLPWVRAVSGERATREEIAAEFLRVQRMTKGLPHVHYRGSLRLPDPAIDDLAFARLRVFLKGLPGVFPGFDGFPLSVRQVLLDLAFNNGLGAEATDEHPASGLRAWVNLRAACNRVPPDWATASKHCTVANPNNLKPRAARNKWRQDGFLAALRGVG